MEPERKIEKLLRAFANKRRADAGGAFKLHPATRRLLQGEVARRAPKPPVKADSLWQRLRKRWAVRLGFALVLCLGAALFWPGLHQSKPKSENVEAMISTKPLGAAATIAAVDNRSKLPATPGVRTNPLASVPVQMETINSQPAGHVAAGGFLANSQSNNVLAYAPENKTDRATVLADSVAQTPRDKFSLPANRRQPVLALAENAPSEKVNEAPAPVVAPVVVAATPPVAVPVAVPSVAGEPTVFTDTAIRTATPPPGSVSGTAAATEGFAAAASSRELRTAKMVPAHNATKFKSELTAQAVQVEANNSQRFVQTAAKKTSPVLESFELQQNGDRISVVDRDGSIYNGRLQPVELAAKDGLSRSRATVAKPGLAALQENKFGGAANAEQAAQPPAQNYFFRVSGASRSLKANVVFAGNLIQLSNTTANTAQNFGGGLGGGQLQRANGNVAQQLIFSNSRITGTVTIDKTNQIEINALPVNP